MFCTLCTILDHLKDGEAAVFGVVLMPVVRLHQAWVSCAARRGGGWVQRAAISLLYYGAEDDAMVNE